jgi:hypothetical protein
MPSVARHFRRPPRRRSLRRAALRPAVAAPTNAAVRIPTNAPSGRQPASRGISPPCRGGAAIPTNSPLPCLDGRGRGPRRRRGKVRGLPSVARRLPHPARLRSPRRSASRLDPAQARERVLARPWTNSVWTASAASRDQASPCQAAHAQPGDRVVSHGPAGSSDQGVEAEDGAGDGHFSWRSGR